MKNKYFNRTMIITSILCLIPILIYLFTWDKLPEQMPVHFNSSGEADRYASKAFAAIGLPLILFAANVLINFAVEADPKNSSSGKEMKAISKWMVPVISIIVNGMVALISLNIPINISVITFALIGLLFIIVGNYLPKSKRNYTIGIKLPWTLNSDENWNKTHRLAGYLFIVSGLLMLVNAFVNMSWIFFVAIALCVFVPTIYSFLLYKKGI